MRRPDDGAVLPTLPLDLRPDQYLIVNGRVRPLVCGGEGEGAPAGVGAAADAGQSGGDVRPATTPPAGQPDPAADAAARQARETEIRERAERETRQRVEQELRALAEQEKAEREKATMTEAERAKAEAAEVKAAAEAERAEAAKDRRLAKIERRLTGLEGKALEMAVAQLDRELAADFDDDTLAKAADEVRKVFATPAGGAPSGVPGGNPAANRNTGGKSPLELGRERAKRDGAAHQGATRDDLLRQYAPQPSPFPQSA